MVHVFISYSQKDGNKRDQVASLLRANDIDVRFDEEFVETGDHLTNTIFPAIKGSRCLLVIHTKNSSGSGWILKEIEHAISNAIPVLVISFGSAQLPQEYPEHLQEIRRVIVPGRFTQKKKEELVHYVSRSYNRKSAPVVTLLNVKGGVGKTVLTANLFGCLHEHKNMSVLLIDLDPQHNLTQLLLDTDRMAQAQMAGCSVMAMFRGFGQPAIDNNRSLTEREIKTSLENSRFPLKKFENGEARLDLIPGTFELITYFLGDQQQFFNNEDPKWTNFKHFIEYCRTQYDVVAIDVNPGASLMTMIALEESTHILSPIRPDRFARYGIELLHLMLKKLNIKNGEKSLLAIMNGVKRTASEDIETDLRDNIQKKWSYDQKIMRSRIAYSKKLEVRQVSPTVKDLTANLAYKSKFGSNAIKNDLVAASDELIGELDL